MDVTGSIYGSGIAQPYLTTFWLYSALSAQQYNLRNLYPITLFNQYITTTSPNVDLASVTPYQKTTTQAVTLPSIPSNIWVYVQETKQQRSVPWSTDTFCPIQNINVTLGVRSGLLSQSYPESLYQMSTRNGLKMSYFEFANTAGSVICLNLSKDLPLLKNLAIGSQDRLNLSMNITWSNPKYYQSQFDIVMLTGHEGILELYQGSSRLLTSIVTSGEIANALIETGDYDTTRVNNDEIVGGSIGENFKHWSNKIRKIGRKAYDLYEQNKNAINPIVAGLAKHYVGRGYTYDQAIKKAEKDSHKGMSAGGLKKGKGLKRGRGLVAGSMISGDDSRLTSNLNNRA